MINPNNYEDYVQRGNVYFESRDAENALKNFDKAIQINFNKADAHYCRGNVYFALGEFPKAL